MHKLRASNMQCFSIITMQGWRINTRKQHIRLNVIMELLCWIMAALHSNGQAIKFYSCDLLFIFSHSDLRSSKMLPCGTCARMLECGVIM